MQNQQVDFSWNGVVYIIMLGLFMCTSSVVSQDNESKIKIMVTGFEAFGKHQVNPTQSLMQAIESGRLNHPKAKLYPLSLPVTYYQSWAQLQRHIQKIQPDLVLCLGYAPNSKAIRLETRAHNYDRGHPDNAGRQHRGLIVPGEQEFYASRLPLTDIAQALERAQIPVMFSNDAGGYICNQLFYLLMRYCARHQCRCAGFIHVPLWPVDGEQGLAKVLTIIIDTINYRHQN